MLETNTCLLVNQLLAGNYGDSDSSKFNFVFAMDRLASPRFIIPRIRQINYHRPNQTTDLSDLFGFLLGDSLIGKCRVPPGQSQEILYTILPFCSFTQIEAKISFYTSHFIRNSDSNWRQSPFSASKNVRLTRPSLCLGVAARRLKARDMSQNLIAKPRLAPRLAQITPWILATHQAAKLNLPPALNLRQSENWKSVRRVNSKLFLYPGQVKLAACNRRSLTHFRLRGCREPLRLLNLGHVRCVGQQ